jgi:hypothetical protein
MGGMMDKQKVMRNAETWVVWWRFKRSNHLYGTFYNSILDAHHAILSIADDNLQVLGPPEHIVKEWEE